MYNNLLDVFAPRAGVVDLALYVALSSLVVAMRPSRVRSALLAGLSLALVGYWLWDGPWERVLAVYAGMIGVQSLLLAWSASRPRARLLPILFPLAALVAVEIHGPIAVVGFSYLAFRMAHNGYEVVAKRARWPGFWDYLAYCVFLPTLIVGPISPLSLFESSLAERAVRTTAWQGLLRIVVGLVKVRFIATLCKQLTFGVLWKDGYLHGPEDFAISCAADLLYLYFNFSGFCDVVIAIAALIGIDVKDNFDAPLASRNLREFWARWHVTLGDVARSLVFTPMSQALGRAWGRRGLDWAICLSTLATFAVIGVWHGFTLNFLLFGVAHGVGVCVVHLYDQRLVRRLSAPRRKAYLASRVVRVLACALTLGYAAGAMFLFDNDVEAMRGIARSFEWRPNRPSGHILDL